MAMTTTTSKPGLQHRVVARLDRGQQKPAEPGQREQALDDHRAAEDLDQDQADEGDERDRDVPQHVLEEHDTQRHALGDRGAHVVLVEGRDDALPHELAVGRGLEQAEA